MKFKVLVLIVFWTMSSFALMAQEDGSFTMELSSDTVLMGNTISLSYNIENMAGNFAAPDLSDFRIVAGPNVSSQYSSFNGKVTQKSSHTYYLMPKELGIANIGAAKFGRNEHWIELEPISITVLENPHGIDENFGSPITRIKANQKQDTLSQEQKIILEKLKKGKKKKI